MANDYYNHGTWPATSSSGSSALARTEMDAITAGFAKLAALTGNAGKFTLVNSTSDGQTVSATLSETAGVLSATALTIVGVLTANGAVTVTGALTATANAASIVSQAVKLQTARTINGVAFDGTGNITVADATKLPLTGGTLTGPVTLNSTTNYGVLNATLAAGAIMQFSTAGAAIGYLGNSAGTSGLTTGIGLRSETGLSLSTGGSAERIVIDANGLVGVGAVPVSSRQFYLNAGTNIYGRWNATGAATSYWELFANGVVYGYFGNSNGTIGTATGVNLRSETAMSFTTGGSGEKMIIGSTGDVTSLGVAISRSKSAVTFRNSTTTMTDDPDLVVPLTAGRWSIDGFLPIRGVTTGGQGFRFAVAFSGTSTTFYQGAHAWVASAVTTSNLNVTPGSLCQNYASVSTGVQDWVRVIGEVVVTVAGNLSIQWAQNSSNANNTALDAGAYLNCVKVG